MRVKDAMCADVRLISPSTTLREAAQEMRDSECGYLPVGENDRLVGAITDRDIIVRGLAANHNPDDAMVRDIMTKNGVYCVEDDDLKSAATKMKEKQIRRLIVLNHNKRLSGILSIGDIARHSNDNNMTGEIVRNVAKAAKAA